MNQSLAPKKPFAAPMVDQLSVRVVVDSRYERFLPKMTHPFTTIENVGQIPGRQMTSLACEWGLSLHLESQRAGSKAQYMLDFGYTPEIVLRNADLLDIDPAKIDGLILSHAHRDHFGYDHFTDTERRGKLLKDTHPDEHATCYIVQGRGLVVISSCGHVGLINTVKHAMAVSGVSQLHAVIGGFHLVTAPQDYIEQTVTELDALKPDVVIPMHCSGADFIETMRRRMPNQLVTTNVGTRFTFGG